MPYYTMRCFTGVFYFSSRFLHLKQKKNEKKQQENCATQVKMRKYITLYVGEKHKPVAFFSRFHAFLLTNLPKRKLDTKCNMGLRRPSKWVDFQTPKTHIRAFFILESPPLGILPKHPCLGPNKKRAWYGGLSLELIP